MAGKIVYPSGDPGAVTYNFEVAHDFEPKIGYLETSDNQRAFDGTLNSFRGSLKKYYEIAFSYVPQDQWDFFMQLYRFHCPVDLYLDGVNLDGTVLLMNSPESGPMKAPGDPLYSFTLRFEEV